MTAQKGEDLLLKIGNGATPTESFADIGGMRGTSFALRNRIIDASSLTSGKWRKLAGSAGIQSFSVSGEGYFTDSSAEETLRGYAFSGAASNYELHFGNGDKISGSFIIAEYSRSGDMKSQENYAIRLESAGEVSFVSG